MTKLSANNTSAKNADEALSRQVNTMMKQREAALLERVAKQEMRSLSSASRKMILAGLDQYFASSGGEERKPSSQANV